MPSRRRSIAHAAWWFAAVLFAVAAVASLFGGFTLGPLSVTSWLVMRVVIAAAAVGFWAHPARAEALGRVEQWLSARPWALWSAAGAAIAWAGLYKVMQHAAFRTSAYDLSLYHHALDNTLEGRFLHAFGLERSFFSEHASPFLLLLLPIYAVLRSPLTLLVVHGAGAAAAIIPLFALARREGASRVLALGIACAFFFNGVLWHGVWFDFHPEVLAPLGLFAATWAYRQGRWLAFYACVALSLSLKEELGFVVASAAVFWAVTDRSRWRHAAVALGLGVAWAWLSFSWIIPASYPVAAERSHFIARYGHLGATYWEVAVGLLTRPLYVLGLLVGPPVREFLASTGGTALLSPLALVLAAPLLILHLASAHQPQAELSIYYAVPALGVAFLGIARALARLAQRRGEWLALGLAALAIGSTPRVPFWDKVTEADRAGRVWLDQLPDGARVSAQNSVLPHLSPQRPLVLFPALEGAEWVVLDRARSRWPLEPHDYREQVLALLRGGELGVVQYDGRFIVLRRGASTAVNALVAGDLEREP